MPQGCSTSSSPTTPTHTHCRYGMVVGQQVVNTDIRWRLAQKAASVNYTTPSLHVIGGIGAMLIHKQQVVLYTKQRNCQILWKIILLMWRSEESKIWTSQRVSKPLPMRAPFAILSVNASLLLSYSNAPFGNSWQASHCANVDEAETHLDLELEWSNFIFVFTLVD